LIDELLNLLGAGKPVRNRQQGRLISIQNTGSHLVKLPDGKVISASAVTDEPLKEDYMVHVQQDENNRWHLLGVVK